MIQPDALASVLVDHALAEALVPWPCPSDFGPGGRYRLEEVIGAGQDSLVYRAKDRRLSSEGFDARVAIKVSRHAESVRHEALSVRRIAHPNVLAIIDQGTTDDGAAYLVAELVDGGDLSGVETPMEARAAATLVAKIARGVQAAHGAGVVHCDLKPANILLTREGEPKLADFDLARWTTDEDEASRGNVAFMSPEQFRGEPDALSPPSDVYALGGLLYWLLTGNLPHGETRAEVAQTHAAAAGPPSPGKNRTLDMICRRAMSLDRTERHHSAGQFAEDLQAWLEHRPVEWTRPGAHRRAGLWVRRHPARAVLAAAAMVAAGAAVGVYFVEAAREREAQERSIRLANEEIEKIKSDVRGLIRDIARTTFNPNTGVLFLDRALPTLVWLEWIFDSPLLDENTRMSMSGERTYLLRTAVEQAEASGRVGHLDDVLARYCLAHFLTDQGESAEPLALLAEVKAQWGPRLPPKDIFWNCVDAVELCAAANGALQSGSDTADFRRRLLNLHAEMSAEGRNLAVTRMILRTIKRLEAKR